MNILGAIGAHICKTKQIDESEQILALIRHCAAYTHTHTTGLYLALVGVRAHRASAGHSAGQCTVQASLLFSQLAQLFCATACCWLPVVEWRG